MKQRDKNIINDLQRFRVMSRDDITELHFKGLKNPTGNCNTVLKRLFRDGYIDRNTNTQPYLYFPKEKTIKKDSAKIPHFLEILHTYKDMMKYKIPSVFTVEPKYGKGFMEPDIFTIWKGAPLWIEVQRSIYSEEVMLEKINRYEAYYDSGLIMKESWQPKDNPIFPAILILSSTRYPVESSRIKIMQAKSISEFMVSLEKPKPTTSDGIKIKIG